MYYNRSVNEIFKELQTNECGLSQENVKKRLDEFGFNTIKIEKETSLWVIILRQFTDPLIYILLIAAVITLIIQEYINTTVIIATILFNAVIGFFQEYSAEKATQAIKKLAAPKAFVIRDCQEEKVDALEIVPGDIVALSAGNKVPADIRLFEINELEIDESMLTGESIPVEKQVYTIDKNNILVVDQVNMAFMGSVVTQGKGKGVVVRTGEKTELGKISEQVAVTGKVKTPLQKKLAGFSRRVGTLSLGLALFVFVLGLSLGHSLIDIALFAISMAVAVIPEGLPIVITITMAIGLKRMAEKNAIVRKLISVETLGSCNYICSDKTGTITENRMTVTMLYANGKEYHVKGTGYKPEGDILLDNCKIYSDEDLARLLLTGLLCNSSSLYEEDGEWKIDGDPTEGALVVAAQKFGINIEKKEYQYKLANEIPFNSKRQYMVTLHKKNGNCTIFVKGAPEKILHFSGKTYDEQVLNQYYKMAGSGLRVLGFGIKELKDKCTEDIDLEYEATNGLQFVGFQGIIDPPRRNVYKAIRETKEAGIKTVMITGDHKITAASIAKRIGILKSGDMTITGSDLDSNDENFLKMNVEKIAVYARVSPCHKLKIVQALQDKGNIVAVTGDGVNDAPALRKGNIGVAMGQAGTDVAREASDIILKDDNFATIFEAVKVGRVIYDNIQKVIFFLLGTGFGFAVVIILALLLGMPLPFLATQVLWTNLVTNGLQDVALAYEPEEKGITKRPPRDPGEKIINLFLLKRLILVGIVLALGTLFIFWYKLHQGMPLAYARTAAFNTAVFTQFFHVLNARSFDTSVFKMNAFSNPFLLISLFLALIAQVAVIVIGPLQYIFSTTQLDAVTWIQTVATGAMIIVAVEIDKQYRKKH